MDDPLEGVVEALDERRRARGAAAFIGERLLSRLHLGAVVVAEQVQQPVRRAARATPPRRPAGRSTTSPSARGTPAGSASRPSIGNESTSVASSMPRCSRFSARISSGPTKREPELAVVDALRGEHAPRELDRRPARRPRAPLRFSTSTATISGSAACRSPPRARCRPRRSAARACAGRRPGALKRTNSIPSTPSRMSCTWISPDAWSRGRSTCVTSPVTTTFEPKPSRVRNICICSGLVFCASSRMMKLSFSVRPRMKASGATSIVPRSMYVFGSPGRACRRARRRAGAGTGRPSRACRPAGTRAARRPRPRGA